MTEFFSWFSLLFFLLPWRAASQSPMFTPDLTFSPKIPPFILPELQVSDFAGFACETSLKNIPVFLSSLFKTFQRNKIPISLAAWEPQHSLQHILLLVGLAKWKKKGKPHMKIPNCHHLTFGGKNQEKIMWEFSIFKLWLLSSYPKISVFALWFKPLWKNSLREGPKAGIPGKYFTLFLLAAPLPLQLSFHHWVHHPEHNQGLKHLKTRLSQPRKRAGFNVCRSTKALSPEHLTYWQAVWKGKVFLQVSSYSGSSEESISITIPHTDRAPRCFNSPRCCSCLSALYIKIITPINLNWARK